MRWLVALLLLIAALLGARLFALRQIERGMIRVHPQGKKTPRSPHEAVSFTSGDRTLHAFYVPGDGPALLIFHGNNEAISGWSDALDLLHAQGLTAMVFDYSGFGTSTGSPGAAHFHEDGLAAWHVFKERVPAATRTCAYGLSLGSGVLLDVASELQPPPDCVVVSGAFTSVTDAAVRMGRVPSWAGPLLPGLFDNVAHIAGVKAPVLIEHGSEDELFPVEGAKKLAAARPGAQLVVIPGMHHADPVAHPSEAAWLPVVRFVRGR